MSDTTRIVLCCVAFALALWLRSPLVGFAILGLLAVLRAMARSAFRAAITEAQVAAALDDARADARSPEPRRLTA